MPYRGGCKPLSQWCNYRERLERLSNTKKHEKKFISLCKEIVGRIRKLGYDEAIVQGRLKKLLGVE